METFDAVIVGAGASGLSAALALGRGCRTTLVFADGPPRNAKAAYAHNLFTRDCTPPGELIAAARAEVEPYGVVIRDVAVADAEAVEGGFVVTPAEGVPVRARTLVLATGVVDELPALGGLHAAWGVSAVHCPYCHGWEFRGRPTAVLGNDEKAYEEARLLTLWTSDLVLLTDGSPAFGRKERRELEARGVVVEERELAGLEQEDGHLRAVLFCEGEPLPRAVLYVRPSVHQRSPIAERLGATVTDAGLVAIDEVGRAEGVPGLFVVGDAAGSTHQLVAAAASGTKAAFALSHDLIVADTPRAA